MTFSVFASAKVVIISVTCKYFVEFFVFRAKKLIRIGG